MIYHLAVWLTPSFGALNLFTYVTSRAAFAMLTALALGFLLGPRFIRRRDARHMQPIREDGPQSHQAKQNTPTMGGGFILLSMSGALLLWGDLQSFYLWVALAALLYFGLVGYCDDRAKIAHGTSRGLSARAKIGLQSAGAAVLLFALLRHPPFRESIDLIVPFAPDLSLPLGVGGFCALGYLAIVGSSNAVNLTDGLDGLAILPAIAVAGGLGRLRLCRRTRRVFDLSRLAASAGGARDGDFLRRLDRRRTRVFVVQRVSGGGVYGRCRLARDRSRVGDCGGDCAARNRVHHYERRFRGRGIVGHHASRVLQNPWAARVSNGAFASSF